MAPAPAEIDVFSGPHSRMKRLVQLYSDKLSEVDVSSCADLRALLWSLRSTFTEFKTHEHIENECIMWKLKNRLQFLKVEIDAVSEVHSDNKLSEMVTLVEEGCTKADRCTCPKEAATIGHNLIRALHKFTDDFLPHMQEEEEIFQPLLMEYFSYSELKEIKSDVIKRHQQLTKYCPEEKGDNQIKAEKESDSKDLSCNSDNAILEQEEDLDDDDDDNSLSKIQGLPMEVLLNIFSYLNPWELSQCSMVCSRWSCLARDPCLWKHLSPTRWARGDWQFRAPAQFPDDDEDDPYDRDVYVVVDEDADFDESTSSALESDSSNTSVASYRAACIRHEARMLVAMVRYLLPYVGQGVESLNLAKSKGVTNGLVYKLLTQCPNLQHLNLAETKVSDIAFKGLGKHGSGCKLRHLDLSGCTNISDLTLKRLASILQEKAPVQAETKRFVPCTHAKSRVAKDETQASYFEHVSDKNGRPLYRCSPKKTEKECSGRFAFHNENDRKDIHRTAHCLGHKSSANDSSRIHPIPDNSPRTRGCSGSSCTDSNKGSSCHGNQDDVVNNRVTKDGCYERNLEFLSLSGCYRITDSGLRALSQAGGWPHLKHLDMSGCLNISALGLSQLAEASPALNHQEFFYCDNIEEGPYADTASGCQNLQCSNRVCCRSGE
ncbi:F-box/LRR-repeat protein 5-like [Diadema setosum]|uniref:F-box/LRR-repeat protein 5-like n=1 Tax=Diadema setosum TaxID=31175 RepID=UPI003B3B0C4F